MTSVLSFRFCVLCLHVFSFSFSFFFFFFCLLKGVIKNYIVKESEVKQENVFVVFIFLYAAL